MTLLRRTRTGVLHLHFGVRAGRTVLLRDLQKAPLMIVRPFELPCGTLMVFIVNPMGGVLGGDHSEVRVRVEGGARALVLTQSATRVQPSPDRAAATQDVTLEVAPGGRLEFYPERTIPFAGSAFRQTVLAELGEGAELGLTETLAGGRVRSGESLAFHEYASRMEVRRGGRRVYLDALRLCPGEHTRSPGVWGGGDYLASGVWVGAPQVTDWPAVPGQLATGQAAGGAAWLRAVADCGPGLDAALGAARESLRRQLFGAPPLRVRR
ncbi:urease accessory protein UreD (plasmid) [Deinococcus aetherius]|uniref:Urease accessory protein UreD n=1 Tax=Deinococcus aetherius TaxID=200252 RepID=A0ABM8AKB3_9DEIO|nr:urease accessory protein UreD [Deinococcus aetherius]BDP44268.1 urease accessory protein UreD [Deinococcus aetherius]